MMKIKDYMCKECDCTDFFFADKGNQKGIYCSNCGKWLKWADKNEQNLAMQQEQETQQDTGYWINHIEEPLHNLAYLECSKCKTWFLRDYLIRNSYCPNCGAKMKGEVK